MMKKQKILAIVGPSSSGKSALAIELAKKLGGEVISADSRLIYRELNIGTAKPSVEEMSNIPHYLIDIKEPTEDYTVAEFLDDSSEKILDIVERKKLPIIAGGTGLYFRILLEDYDLPRVAPNEELRAKLEQKTSEELYKMLQELDSESAKKIHYNNKVKIIRALEVCLTLNRPMSEAQGKKESNFDVFWVGLTAQNRDFLYDRINQRVEHMVAQGLIEEAKLLFDKYGELPLLMNTIGYQELFPYFMGSCSLDEAKDQIKQNTRRYAKRQLSWFRSNRRINWFNIDEMNLESIASDIVKKFSSFPESGNC